VKWTPNPSPFHLALMLGLRFCDLFDVLSFASSWSCCGRWCCQVHWFMVFLWSMM